AVRALQPDGERAGAAAERRVLRDGALTRAARIIRAMTNRTRGRADRTWIAALGTTLLMAACGGDAGTAPPTPAPTPQPAPTTGTCAIPIAPPSEASSRATLPKPESTDDRGTRRGRVYEELWKHQAAVARRRVTPAAITPAATAE